MAGYQYEVQDVQSEALMVEDPLERQCLKETNEAKQQSLTDLQGRLNKDDNAPEGLRRSERTRNPTEKMRALQYDEVKKKEKRLLATYEQWKLHTRKARDQLKTYMPESQLWSLIEELKKDKEDIMNIYYEIRNLTTPSTDIRRRVDTCESVTTEITNIAYGRAIDDEGEFNEQKERHRLHELLRHDHAKSVYGSAASLISHSQSDHYSISSAMTAKRADAAAELAVKEANYQMLLEEETQKELIRQLEEQQHGDPVQFIERKAAFTSLVDQRVIAPAEKLYYLKKYVGGPARQVLDGTFYRNDNEAHRDVALASHSPSREPSERSSSTGREFHQRMLKDSDASQIFRMPVKTPCPMLKVSTY